MAEVAQGPRHSAGPPPRDTRETIRRIVLVLSVLLFIGSAVYLVKYYGERWLARQEMSAVQESARTRGLAVPAPETPFAFGAFEPRTREALDELTATNPDFIGWITIPNTNIDYPVVAGVDNVKYLSTTFEGNRRSAGTVFLEKGAQLDFSSQNSVLYGHNMLDKTMFQNLVLLRAPATREGIDTVYLQKPNGVVNVYRIFTAYVCKPDYDYRNPQYSEEDFPAFVERMVMPSEIPVPTDVDISFDDRFLGLSTCVYDFNDARYVVHAVLEHEVPTQ